MHIRPPRKHLPGTAAVAVLASMATMGAAFALPDAFGGAAVAQGRPITAPWTSGSWTSTTASTNVSSACAGTTTSTSTTTSSSTTTTSSTTTSTSSSTSTSWPGNTPTLQEVQQVAARAVSNRVWSLDRWIGTVQGDASFLGTDGTTLINEMCSDIADLQALGQTIAGATSVSQALTDYHQIFAEYRVYLFVLTDAQLVIEVDRDVKVTLPAVQQQLTTVQGEVNGSTPSRVTTLLTDAGNELTKVTTATTGLDTQLLSYTAAEWDANPKLLSTSRGAVNSASFELALARFDIQRAERLMHYYASTTTTSSTTSTSDGNTTTTTTRLHPGGNGNGHGKFHGRGKKHGRGHGNQNHGPRSTTTTTTTS